MHWMGVSQVSALEATLFYCECSMNIKEGLLECKLCFILVEDVTSLHQYLVFFSFHGYRD